MPEVTSNSLSVTNKENISSNGEHTTTVLSKYLSTPTITKPKSSTCAITTARVLTSAECLDIIREKETKKKAAKQQRKREREEKKKKAEEEKQRKAEERKRKLALKAESARKAAEENAEKAKKIAQEKARKIVEKEHRLAKKARRAEEQRQYEDQREAQNVDKNSNATTSNDFVDEEAAIQRSSRKRHRDRRSSVAKKKCLGETEASSNENQCCAFFKMYDSLQGDWVQCFCMRWLHEDFVLDAIKDADDNIRLCPYCID